MRSCPQCGQSYYDDTNFCLNDGAVLVSTAAPTVQSIEIPTVVRNEPVVIPTPPTFQNQAFQTAPVTVERRGGGSVLAYLAIGFVALLIGGAIVGGAFYAFRNSGESNTANDNKPKTESSGTASGKKDDVDEEKEKLKAEQQKLEEDRKRLEQEKQALEAKKKLTPTPPPPTDNARTGYIIDPPSNVRATPNGRIICVIRGAGSAVRILGSTGVSDSNGTWYFTDACGQRGVIHSSQFRY